MKNIEKTWKKDPFIDPCLPVGQPFLNAADVEISFLLHPNLFLDVLNLSASEIVASSKAAFVHVLQLKVSDWMHQSTTSKGNQTSQ